MEKFKIIVNMIDFHVKNGLKVGNDDIETPVKKLLQSPWEVMMKAAQMESPIEVNSLWGIKSKYSTVRGGPIFSFQTWKDWFLAVLACLPLTLFLAAFQRIAIDNQFLKEQKYQYTAIIIMKLCLCNTWKLSIVAFNWQIFPTRDFYCCFFTTVVLVNVP